MYTAKNISEIVGGCLSPGSDGEMVVRDLLIDSRRLIRPEGTMFVALVSSRNDGHAYVDEMYEKGVRVFLVLNSEMVKWRSSENAQSRNNENFATSLPRYLATFIGVSDTLQALQQLAAYHRQQFNIPVIGITGSNGKTIVKEWLYQLISPEVNVIRSPKSYNSQIGVPLSVWKMEKEHALAIFEAGISMPGEMEKLEEIIRPEYGIITNIGHAHDEHFASTIQKTDEKLKLFKHSKVVVYCSDHELIDSCVRLCDPERTFVPFSWSRHKEADLRVRSEVLDAASEMQDAGCKMQDAGSELQDARCKMQDAGTRITCNVSKTGEEFSFAIPFTDEASVENAIHCFAMMLCLEQCDEEAMLSTQAALGERSHRSGGLKMRADYVRTGLPERFAFLAPVEMRLELKDAINHCSLINDSYSNDIDSLSIALDFLHRQDQHQKKTLILSDILQSGRDKNELYDEIAALLESKGISKLIGIGRDLNKYAAKFGMQKSFFHTTDDFLLHYPLSSFQDESILLKGARLFEFERISHALQQKAHETVLEINLDAMVHNLNHYRALLRPGVKTMAMVKAFSYGSGSFEIANLLQYHHVDYLAVAYADEGVELRKAGIRLPIMVMSPEEHSLETLLKYNLEPEIYNLHILNLLEEAVKRNQTSNQEAVRIHIKLDTGMHRLGFQRDEVDELIKWMTEARSPKPEALSPVIRHPANGVRVVSIFSHLAASEDGKEDSFTRKQIRLFGEMSSKIIAALGYPVLLHILNSAGVSRFRDAQFEMVRLGIGLYGIGSSEEEAKKMRNVCTLRTSVVQVKTVRSGETIGYNRKWTAGHDTQIAVIPIGYADGLDRRLGNGVGWVWINGKAARIIGNVCMDLCMIDVTGIKGVKVGDEVEVFGEHHPITEMATEAGTIPYEIMTGISRRVKRVYYHE